MPPTAAGRDSQAKAQRPATASRVNQGDIASRAMLTMEQVADALNVGRTTVWQLMVRGELATVNIGRCRRIPVSSLSAYVARKSEEATADAAARRTLARRRRTV